MPKIEPPKLRSIIREDQGRLEIVIPVKTNWLITGFLGFWLLGWAAGECFVPVMMFVGKKGPPLPFAILWLAMWTFGGAFALLIFLWQIFGREIVRVEGTSLITRRAIGGCGRCHEFDLGQVKNLRIAPVTFNMFDPMASFHFFGLGGGIIAFDYGARTFRFARGIDEPEAKRLVEVIERHH